MKNRFEVGEGEGGLDSIGLDWMGLDTIKRRKRICV